MSEALSSRVRIDVDTMLDCAAVRMPTDLPAADLMVEACARAMAVASAEGPLVAFDYTAAGLDSSQWSPIVSRMRGLVLDVSRPRDPVVVWPTPIVADLRADTNVPAHMIPDVQEKLDGVLLARFAWNDKLRWSTRGRIGGAVEEYAQQWWARRHGDDRGLPPDTVLYTELCDRRLPTPTHASPEGLYLLDVMDRRDGAASTPREVAALAERAGLRTPRTFDWPGSLRPFAEHLSSCGPEVEGYVFRWSHDIRGRLVNEKYRLLWNLLETRSVGAIVDLWLAYEDLGLVLEWIPPELHAGITGVYEVLSRVAVRDSAADFSRNREDAAHALLAAVGGPNVSTAQSGI